MVQKVAQQEIYQTPQEAPVGSVLPIIPTGVSIPRVETGTTSIPITPIPKSTETSILSTAKEAVLSFVKPLKPVGKVVTSYVEPLKPAKEAIISYVKPLKPVVGYAKTAAPYVKETAIAMTPILGTIQYAKQSKKDGWTAGEMGWIAGSAILDILCIIPIIGGISAGARAAKGIGTGARITAVGKATGRVAIAEVIAPYTIVRHPIQTVKGIRAMVDPIETLVRGKKIPLTGVEIREATVHLPIKAVGSEKDTILLRNIAMDRAVSGVKPIARVGDTQFELSRVAIQKTAVPVAIHSTPDIRPFLEGATIQGGREGGMFVAPNLHTRFTLASAFGDIPEGGIRGALIIRDKQILSQLIPSGKVYRKAVEMELVLRKGTKLPKPSQTLFTRDIVGDRIALVVFGKPFNAAEIAKMKIIGSTDLIKDIFISPAKISKLGKTAIKEYDELNDLRKAITVTRTEAKQLRIQGKIKEAVEATRKATRLQTRVNRLSISLSTRLAGRAMTSAGLRLAALNFQRTSPLERWETVTSTSKRIAEADSRTSAGIQRIRTLSRMNISEGIRVSPTRDNVKRPRIPGPKRRISDKLERRVSERPERKVPERRILPPPDERRVPPPPDRKPPPPRRRIPPPPPDRRLPNGYVPLLPLPPGKAYKKLTLFERKGAVAWKQGFIYKLIYPPYGQDDIINSRKPIPGVKLVKGARSAYESIAKARDKRGLLPSEIARDMGIMDIKITTPEQGRGKPKLQFKRDVKQKTRTTPAGISGIRR